MKYQGFVIDRLTDEVVAKSRHYKTWEAAHRAVDKPVWAGARYQIKVKEVRGIKSK